MRLATLADVPVLEAIALATLKAAYPGQEIGGQHVAPHIGRKGVIVACDDATRTPTAFIRTERIDQDNWKVVALMPRPATITPPENGLILFAFQTEHALRPMKPDCHCFTQLQEASQVEKDTRDRYQTAFSTATRTIKDAGNVTKATELSLTAAQLAAFFGVPFP